MTKELVFWAASRIIEGDQFIKPQNIETLLPILEITKNAKKNHTQMLDILIADNYYQEIHNICQNVRKKSSSFQQSSSQKLDSYLLDQKLSLPIFMIVMSTLFTLSIEVGGALQKPIEIFFNYIFILWTFICHKLAIDYTLVKIISVGLIQGLVTTCSFIPVLSILFFILYWLEDSGYMARVSLIVDRMMGFLGLPGRSLYL